LSIINYAFRAATPSLNFKREGIRYRKPEVLILLSSSFFDYGINWTSSLAAQGPVAFQNTPTTSTSFSPFHHLKGNPLTMADIDMTDAPSGSAALAKKAVGKAKAGGSDTGAAGKKRFEVKKVRCLDPQALTFIYSSANTYPVECSSSMGLGYRRRQLCYLQKPHHGFVQVFEVSYGLSPLTNSRHRVSSQPGFCNQRGVYSSLGNLQCKL
jgi:hypothetical protein